MAAVGIRDGIKYGFVLLGYFIAVFALGVVVFGIGALTANSNSTLLALVGGLVAVIGLLVFYAGFLGVAYKIIADGVAAGITSAGGLTVERADTTGSDRPNADRSESEPTRQD